VIAMALIVPGGLITLLAFTILRRFRRRRPERAALEAMPPGDLPLPPSAPPPYLTTPAG
jgi:hypothetical protein